MCLWVVHVNRQKRIVVFKGVNTTELLVGGAGWMWSGIAGLGLTCISSTGWRAPLTTRSPVPASRTVGAQYVSTPPDTSDAMLQNRVVIRDR